MGSQEKLTKVSFSSPEKGPVTPEPDTGRVSESAMREYLKNLESFESMKFRKFENLEMKAKVRKMKGILLKYPKRDSISALHLNRHLPHPAAGDSRENLIIRRNDFLTSSRLVERHGNRKVKWEPLVDVLICAKFEGALG